LCRPVSNRPVTDRHVADRSVADRPVSNHPVTDSPVSDRSVTDCSLVDRSLIERSYSGYLDRFVADHSHANRSLVDHFEMPDRSSGDNRYDNISSNIFYHIRILETYIIFDIINYYYYHKGEIIEASSWIVQTARKIYAISVSTSAHYNWGRRGRRRYEDNNRMTRNDMFTLSIYVLFIRFNKDRTRVR